MAKQTENKTVYYLKKLVVGRLVDSAIEGFYAAVPDIGYKGHPFTIKYVFEKNANGKEVSYGLIEKHVPDWEKAELFRRFDDKFGRDEGYTLGYFKMCDKLPETHGSI